MVSRNRRHQLWDRYRKPVRRVRCRLWYRKIYGVASHRFHAVIPYRRRETIISSGRQRSIGRSPLLRVANIRDRAEQRRRACGNFRAENIIRRDFGIDQRRPVSVLRRRYPCERFILIREQDRRANQQKQNQSFHISVPQAGRISIVVYLRAMILRIASRLLRTIRLFS